IRGNAQDEQKKVVQQMLDLVELSEYADRKVTELSGGQQQCIGLARALAIKPDLFLLDEPLSNIDQSTKFDVATDMKELFDTLHIPIILVTHQYEDAQFFNAKIAVMIEGNIEQTGQYQDLIDHPKSVAVKKLLVPFIGHSK